MKKLKLTPTQNTSILDAIAKENKAREIYTIATTQLQSMASHRQVIMGMILESHGIDPKGVSPNEKINVSGGVLTIGEETTSNRIRNAVKSQTQKVHGKNTKTKSSAKS